MGASVRAPPRLSMGQPLVFRCICGAASPAMVHLKENHPAWICSNPRPREGPSAGAGLKGDASCARPGGRSAKKRGGRAGSGRGAVRCVSGSGGSVRLSARTSSHSRPKCRRMASPLGFGERGSRKRHCVTHPSLGSTPISGQTPLFSLGLD